MLNLERQKKKMTKECFQRAVYRRENVLRREFTSAQLTFTHIMHLD